MNLELPAGIDIHVHFREPGLTDKETMKTGMDAARAGGVLDVVDMPNTHPVTDLMANVRKKQKLAKRYKGIHVAAGITSRSVARGELREIAKITPIFKVFLANSTGDLGISMNEFETALEVLSTVDKQFIMIHAEDPGFITERDGMKSENDCRPEVAEITSVRTVIDLAKDHKGLNLHITHVSSPTAAELLMQQKLISWDVLAKHLAFSSDLIKARGNYAMMNPPLRDENSRKRLFDMFRRGDIPIISSDHAPHSHADKKNFIAGTPGVQETYPFLIDLMLRGEISEMVVRQVIHDNPARILDNLGIDTSEQSILIDTELVTRFDKNTIMSKCGWSLWEGQVLMGSIR